MSTALGAMDPVPAASEPTAAPKVLRRVLRRKVALVSVIYLALVVVIGIVAPLVLPGVGGEFAGDLTAVRQGPSRDHLLGTDEFGRDVLNRLLVGTRPTLIGAAEGTFFGLLFGVSVGLAAGYFGGWTDRTLSRLAEVMFALPGIVVILVVLSVFSQSQFAAMLTFGVLVTPGLMRLIRSAVLPVREQLYIAAARVSGLSGLYIVSRHVLPRVHGPVIVAASFLAGGALLVQGGLAFLGLIAGPPAPSWGGMLAEGITLLFVQPWLIWPPGIAIGLTILAFVLLGDAVRDATAETWSAPAPGTQRRERKHIAVATSEAAPVAKSADALLSVQGLSVAFSSPDGGSLPVVEDVSFDIGQGETVGLVGESACGKTVTAMSILGLLPGTGRVESGRIFFDGCDLTMLSERELHRLRGKEIALISQEPVVGLNPVFRVGWQVGEVVRRHHSVSRKAARARVLELLRRVQLPDPETVARRYPFELSGGMAQRVSIACALAGEPKLLIADEPTTALDVTVQAEILDLLRELQHERGMAVLLVTHDWGVVADHCERVVVMYAGQVVERADLRSALHEPLHPYTEALLAANPHHFSEDAESLPSIPGTVPQPGHWPSGCHFHPRCSYATAECRAEPIALTRIPSGRESRCIHTDQLRAGRRAAELTR